MRRPISPRRPALALAVVVLLLALAPPAAAYEQQVQQLSRELAAQLGVRQVKKVAVVDFTDLRGEVNELGRFLAEELSVALTQAAEGFQVIDRTRLAVVFAEHKLGASGLIAPEDAKRLGQLVGADVLVSATMTPFGESVRLSVKALETETAVLVASARAEVPRTGAIDELLRNGVEAQRRSAKRPDGAAARTDRREPVTAKSFAFELEGCTLSGTTAECLVLVENQVTDRVLTLSASSRLFDDLGNEYAPKRLRIANTDRAVQQSRLPGVVVGGSRSFRRSGAWVEKVMVQGVVTPLALTFEDVTLGTAGVSLLELALTADETDFEVRFRGLPFGAGGG